MTSRETLGLTARFVLSPNFLLLLVFHLATKAAPITPRTLYLGAPKTSTNLPGKLRHVSPGVFAYLFSATKTTVGV